MYCFMHMRGKTVCKFSVKMKIQVVSIFSKTNRLLYSTTTLESTFRGITVGLALATTRTQSFAAHIEGLVMSDARYATLTMR